MTEEILKISDCKLIEKIFRKDRWFAILDNHYNGASRMPHANYIWLKGNPAFQCIPKGYVIHHLDNDPTNDDITNLVIMQKHHHAAHHWKSKTIDPGVKINLDYNAIQRAEYMPLRKPIIYLQKDRGNYIVDFPEVVDGKRKRVKVSRYHGAMMKDIETAEKCRDELWCKDNRELALRVVSG